MIHPPDFEQRIGFDQIRKRLTGYCLGKAGILEAENARFLSDAVVIRQLLQTSTELIQLLNQGDDLPLIRYADPEVWLQRASAEGAFLEASAFIELASGVETAQRCCEMLKRRDDAPSLSQLAQANPDWNPWVNNVRKKIDEDGQVRDNATPALAVVRRRLREESRKVRKLADQALSRAMEKGWSPEGAQVTVREGRLVVPVLAEHKRRLPGYIVDQSSTGQTFFIEPGDVVEAHNDLRDLELEERAEVIRVLRELTATLRKATPSIRAAFVVLGLLDFNRAKARLAIDLKAIQPEVVSVPQLNWQEARHPLLYFSLQGKRPLIPLTISLLDEARFLLVSGPNAGGKSVCLKTVGLIQYMLQCGLPVPVKADSTFGLFTKIFLDIGDQQSIENDLSTYSSHLQNMSMFIREADACSLVLMDELGSGTDPDFGGGIAQAVLQSLLEKGAWGIATTHYYDLKVFAGQHSGIRNAAMLFDREQLKPLFNLSIGQPGSSFALEIAARSGLPAGTIRQAEQIIGEELTGLESLMKQVEEERVKQSAKAVELKKLESQLAEALTYYRELSGGLESKKKEIISKAKSEAATLLQQTNREIEKTIRHIRENKAEKQETRKVRQGLKSLEERVKSPDVQPQTLHAGDLKPGDFVRMVGGEVSGLVRSVKGKTVVVQFGDLRTTVKIGQLVRSADQKQPVSTAPSRVEGIELHRRRSTFSPVLDIRGKRVEEVLITLQRFMDDAVLTGQPEVKIIHGKGEGILRKVVQEFLAGHRQVQSVAHEHADRGGEGVSLVRLK